jgi:hypothetical protein
MEVTGNRHDLPAHVFIRVEELSLGAFVELNGQDDP